MTTYLTIPQITDYEPVESMSRSADGLSFTTIIAANETATRLMQAHERGEQLPLVVLATDTGMVALDEVVVSAWQVSTTSGIPVASVDFLARAVRFV